jgi:hypothetical protein
MVTANCLGNAEAENYCHFFKEMLDAFKKFGL